MSSSKTMIEDLKKIQPNDAIPDNIWETARSKTNKNILLQSIAPARNSSITF